MNARWTTSLLALAAGLASGCTPAGQAQMPPRGPWEAGALYWAIAGVVVAGIVALFLWLGLSRRLRVGLSYFTLGGLVFVLVLFTLVIHIIPATGAAGAARTPRAWDYQPGEIISDPGGSDLRGEPFRGYHLYVSNGCIYCHTGYVRPQDVGSGWGEGATVEDVSATGDFVGYPVTLLGTQRNGPDLTLAGKRAPDMSYQVAHLRAPRELKPNSVMPTFANLSDRDAQDLAAYLVTLGNEPGKVRAGEIGAAAVSLNPAAKRGQELSRSLGCVGCHTVNGGKSVGPTWKGLWGSEQEMSDGTKAVVDEAFVEDRLFRRSGLVVKGYGNVMPSFEGRMSESDVEAIVEYLKAVK